MGMSQVRVIERSPRNRDGSPKFRNAEQAKRYREETESWNELLKRHNVKSALPAVNPLSSGSLKQRDVDKLLALQASLGRLHTKSGGSEPPRQLDVPFDIGITEYTGTEVVALGQLHKSNEIPVMRGSEEHILEIARMRR